MIILGVDTSCEQASCAIYKDGEILERKSEVNKRKHSVTIISMIESLVNEFGISVKDIEKYVVSSGPGSFTGLRIGIAAIKGMAYIQDKKITMIKTLDVLANQSKNIEKIVCPVIDARNNQVYTAIYEYETGFFKPKTDYMGIRIEELANILKGKSVDFLGDASIKHYEFFKETGVICNKPDEINLYPSATVLVKMAKEGMGDVVSAHEAIPFYLRLSQAEQLHGRKN